MAFQSTDLPVMLDLLQAGSTTRREAAEILRRKGRPFTAANWDEFFSKRLKPAISAGYVTIDDVASLLRDAEEHGRQHVFLYLVPKSTVSTLLNEALLGKRLETAKLLHTFKTPRVLGTVSAPTFVETRIEQSSTHQPIALVIKRVSTRESLTFKEEKRTSKTRLVQEYDVEEVRTVDVVRVRHDGLCEVRIQSCRGVKYASEAANLLLTLEPVISSTGFQRVPLTKAKNTMVQKRASIHNEVRFTRSVMANSNGTTVATSSGMQTVDLFSDPAADDSVAAFLKGAATTSCAATNIYVNSGTDPDGVEQWVHVLIDGEPNEFTLTSQCSMREYENVLAAIRFYNK